MQPIRTITVPLCVAGAVLVWLAAVVLRLLAIGESEGGAFSAFSLNVGANVISTVAVFWGMTILFKSHRAKVRRQWSEHVADICRRLDSHTAAMCRRLDELEAARSECDADTRAAIIEAVGLQLLMANDAHEMATNVRQFRERPRG